MMPSYMVNEYDFIKINLNVIKNVWKFVCNFWNINISKITPSIRLKLILYYNTCHIIWSHIIESVAYCNHILLVPIYTSYILKKFNSVTLSWKWFNFKQLHFQGKVISLNCSLKYLLYSFRKINALKV